MTEKIIKKRLFVAIAFLLGSINILYSGIFYVLWIIVAGIFIWKDYQGFVANVKKHWKYLILPLCFIGYIILHYLISLFFWGAGYKASWSRLELLILYFFFIPIYIMSAKNFMTSDLVRRSLLALCWGTLLFNFIKLFYLTGVSLFTSPLETLNTLYVSRFGGHLDFLGGYVYLEPQAIYLSVISVISYFLIVKSLKVLNRKLFYNSTILFLLSLWFLSLTVTKGAILAFLCGFIILSIGYFRRISRKQQLMIGGSIVILVIMCYFLMPSYYIHRLKDVHTEIENLQQGQFVGGSIAPRLALLKESFGHFDQWGVWGLGVYKNATAEDWFVNSQYPSIRDLHSNVHNSFVEFWMIGGIWGLFFMLYYFFVPIWLMVKKKKYSFLLLAILFTLFIGNNTAILMIFIDSSPFILYLLAMAYCYQEQFIELEN